LLIIQIIGGVIIVAVMMSMFSGFASPFLKFLVDSENIKSFNKFTRTMTDACSDGTGTELYFGPSPVGMRGEYVWSLVYTRTARYLSDPAPTGMISCEQNGGQDLCISKTSKDTIYKCRSDYCWCLFELTFKPGECYTENLTAMMITKDAITNEAPKTAALQADYSTAYKAISTNAMFAQTFYYRDDSVSDGVLTSIRINGFYKGYTSCLPEQLGPVQISIYGMKDSTHIDIYDLLGSAELRHSQIGGEAGMKTFEFSGINVESGTNYAIIVSSPGTSQDCAFQWYHSDTDRLSNGKAYSFDGFSLTEIDSSTSKDFTFNVSVKAIPAISKIRAWDNVLKDELKDNNTLKKVRVVQCSKVRDQMECVKENFPVLPVIKDKNGKEGFLTWVQPLRVCSSIKNPVPIGPNDLVKVCIFSKTFLESFSVDRPINEDTGKLEYYTNAYPSPVFMVKTYDDAHPFHINQSCANIIPFSVKWTPED
jgi:hypothetical protein